MLLIIQAKTEVYKNHIRALPYNDQSPYIYNHKFEYSEAPKNQLNMANTIKFEYGTLSIFDGNYLSLILRLSVSKHHLNNSSRIRGPQ